jgi:hypothetical protein
VDEPATQATGVNERVTRAARLGKAVARYRRARVVTLVFLGGFMLFAAIGFFHGDYLVDHPATLVYWPFVVFGGLFLVSLGVLLVTRAFMRHDWRQADEVTQAEYAAAGPLVLTRRSVIFGTRYEPAEPRPRPDDDPFDTGTGH